MELGFSTTQVVLAYVLFNAVYTLGSYPAGALTDRWPRPYVYASGLLAFAVGYVGLALVDGGPAVFVLIAIYGLFPAFTDGVGKAWISALVPDQHRGRAQGVFQALSSGRSSWPESGPDCCGLPGQAPARSRCWSPAPRVSWLPWP